MQAGGVRASRLGFLRFSRFFRTPRCRLPECDDVLDIATALRGILVIVEQLVPRSAKKASKAKKLPVRPRSDTTGESRRSSDAGARPQGHRSSAPPDADILPLSPSGHFADALPACRFVGGGHFVWRAGAGHERRDGTDFVPCTCPDRKAPFCPQDRAATRSTVRRAETL
jgi:hypothetical protein